MAENGNENPVNNKQDSVMAEFRKLRSETIGIHSVFSEKSSINVASLTGKIKSINNICETLMEKQADQDKFNKDLRVAIDTAEQKHTKEMENIKLRPEQTSQEILKELRSMRKELEETKQKIETRSIGNSSSSLNCAVMENNKTEMSEIERKFVLKHTFKNISLLKQYERYFSEEEEHFSVPWRMYICPTWKHLSLFLECQKSLEIGKWLIETECEFKMSGNRKNSNKKDKFSFGNREGNTTNNGWGWKQFIEWDEMKRNFMVDGNLTVEAHVKIKKMTGIYSGNRRNFDETTRKLSDIVLIVEGKKIHVLKSVLASQSTHFKSLLMETSKTEFFLTGIDPNDFQIFLEVLHGEQAINESSVEILLLLAEKFDSQTVTQQCEKFLIEKSEKTLKKKLQLAMKYNLENLKKNCINKIASIADIRSVIPSEIIDIDPSIMVALFGKTLTLLE